MILGSSSSGAGAARGVREMASATAASSSAEVSGPSEANHTSSIAELADRTARATRAAMRGAFSVACGESESADMSGTLAWSALTGSARAPCRRSRGEHELEAQSPRALCFFPRNARERFRGPWRGPRARARARCPPRGGRRAPRPTRAPRAVRLARRDRPCAGPRRDRSRGRGPIGGHHRERRARAGAASRGDR
jgi:hypothetical protein